MPNDLNYDFKSSCIDYGRRHLVVNPDTIYW